MARRRSGQRRGAVSPRRATQRNLPTCAASVRGQVHANVLLIAAFQPARPLCRSGARERKCITVARCRKCARVANVIPQRFVAVLCRGPLDRPCEIAVPPQFCTARPSSHHLCSETASNSSLRLHREQSSMCTADDAPRQTECCVLATVAHCTCSHPALIL
jgi:hypothetical protein